MPDPLFLLQASPPASGGPSAGTIFYLTLLFIFLTAMVTTVVTKWWRDKCLKFFHGYGVTVERTRGQLTWGRLKVFSTGIEVAFNQPYVDARGYHKTSFMFYQSDLETQLLSLFRYEDELDPAARDRRRRQVHRTFNPGPIRRSWRKVRNLFNTLRDAFNQAIGAAVGQFQRMNPASAVLTSQAGSVTQIGQQLLSRFGNAYEPLLEQYIGQPVILDVADPLNPNNVVVQYTGYLADYTQQYVALFNVTHGTGDGFRVTLPDVDQGDPMPALPNPPPPGGPAPALPPPIKTEAGMAVYVDRFRFRVHNTLPRPVVVRSLTRAGYEPLDLGVIVAPNAFLDLPTRDARGGELDCQEIRCLDVVAPRRLAAVRHAGRPIERSGLTDELGFDRLPLVPIVQKIRGLSRDEPESHRP